MMNYWIAISKVLLEGLAVSFAAYFITSRQTDLPTVIMIGLTAALTFFVLDYFAPEIGLSARQGSGFGIGFTRLSGFQFGGGECQPHRDEHMNERCRLSETVNREVEKLPPLVPIDLEDRLAKITTCSPPVKGMTEQSLTPINENINDYKVFPGTYSKYYLRASGAPLTPIH